MWPSGSGFTMQELTGGSKGGEKQSILEVKMSTENSNLDEQQDLTWNDQ